MRYLRLSLALLLALANATPAAADHVVDSTNDTVDNGLEGPPTPDPDHYSYTWDAGGSSVVFFDGQNQIFRFEPYIGWDDGSGLVIESLSSFASSSFSTVTGPSFTPRAGPADSHSSASETRSNSVMTVVSTASIPDAGQELTYNMALTNDTASILAVSLAFYLDADVGPSFSDDRGGVQSAPHPLLLRIFDDGGSAIGLGSDDLLSIESWEVGSAGIVQFRVESGAALSNSAAPGPSDLAAALRLDSIDLGPGATVDFDVFISANPVPEPASFALVALGLVALSGSARHVRRNGTELGGESCST